MHCINFLFDRYKKKDNNILYRIFLFYKINIILYVNVIILSIDFSMFLNTNLNCKFSLMKFLKVMVNITFKSFELKIKKKKKNFFLLHRKCLYYCFEKH